MKALHRPLTDGGDYVPAAVILSTASQVRPVEISVSMVVYIALHLTVPV